MMNTIMIMGRLKEVDLENKVLTINYTTEEKEVKTFCFIGTDKILSSMSEYCKENDMLAIKGHLDIMYNEQIVVIDKVSFLSSNPNK